MSKAKASPPVDTLRQVAAGIAGSLEALRRDGSIGVGRLDRVTDALEDLLGRAGGGDSTDLGNVDRLLLDEATRLRDALAGESCSIRQALDQGRRRYRAALLYRRNGA